MPRNPNSTPGNTASAPDSTPEQTPAGTPSNALDNTPDFSSWESIVETAADQFPARPKSKWDILRKVPFAGPIYDRHVARQENLRRNKWQTNQNAARTEREQAALAAAEQAAREQAAETARRQAEHEAEVAAREQARLDHEFLDAMDTYRRSHDPTEAARNERRQEIAERAFNDVFTPPELIAAEAAAGSPEVTQTTVEYEGKEIPVYTLHGRELRCLRHSIDFKGRGNDPTHANIIGAEVAQELQADPSLWDKGRERLAQQTTGDTATSVSSTLSTAYFDSTRNFALVNRSDLWDYGFSHLQPGSIVRISPGDGGFKQGQGLERKPAELEDHLITPDQVRSAIDPAYHNEFFLNRYDEDGHVLRPDFILTSSRDGTSVPDTVKKHAAYFGVPIYSIDQNSYREKERRRIGSLIESISPDQPYAELVHTFDELADSYVSAWPTAYEDRLVGHSSRDAKLADIRVPGLSPEQKQSLADLELAKKLEFAKAKLEQEIANIKQATAAGTPYFAHQHGLGSIVHADTIQSLAEINQVPDLPTTAAPGHQAIHGDYRHYLLLEFRLGGHTRTIQIHDGKHPAKTGAFAPSATGEDVPDYYAEFAPLVDEYLSALAKN